MKNKLFDKPKICIDLDDTLFDYQSDLRNWHNAKYGTCLKYEDFTDYRLEKVWGGTQEEANKKLKEFHNSGSLRRLSPIEGAVNAINLLYQNGRILIATTSRSEEFRWETENSLNHFFKNKFADIRFSSNPNRGYEGKKTKAEICKELNAFLIDDSLNYILQCQEEGIGAILFGNCPWNQSNGHKGIIRTENWEKTLELLEVAA